MNKMERAGTADIANLVGQLDPRAGPLVISVFGDAIAPRGGNIWLGSLIALMSRFGLSERLVRTVVFRLTRDGWFAVRSRGRRSFYDLTPGARKTFAEADRRIYAAKPPDWDGDWTLVQTLPGMPAGERRRLRDALKWYGFGRLSPTLMVSARTHDASLFDNIATPNGAAAFTARLQDFAGTADPAVTASAAWNIGELSSAYKKLTARFEPLASGIPGDPADCFVLRTLLVHEYRRILLKDPQLPAALAPDDWPGEAARELTAALYRAVSPGADQFISDNVECWSGACPAPHTGYHNRFQTGDGTITR